MQEIRPGLFLGSIGAALHRPSIVRAGVTHIINVSSLPYEAIPGIKIKEMSIPDLKFSHILPKLLPAARFIDEGVHNGKCLVHCFAGRSRGPTLVAAYLIASEKLSVEEALEVIRSKRDVDINSGFIRQLAQFSEKVKQGKLKLPKRKRRKHETQSLSPMPLLEDELRGDVGEIAPI